MGAADGPAQLASLKSTWRHAAGSGEEASLRPMKYFHELPNGMIVLVAALAEWMPTPMRRQNNKRRIVPLVEVARFGDPSSAAQWRTTGHSRPFAHCRCEGWNAVRLAHCSSNVTTFLAPESLDRFESR